VVVCVDDEPHNLDLLDRALRRRFDVITEAMPEAALTAIMANDEVSVVVADFRMPSMNGVEMLAKVASARPEIRRVLVTGYADADVVQAAVAAGEVHYVVRKPWRPPELVTLLTELARARDLELDNSRLLGELHDAQVRLLERERQLERARLVAGDDANEASDELERITRELAIGSFRDALTGLYTHGVFQERLREEVARAQRAGQPLALLLLDVDGFAAVNKAVGYQAGDQILRRIAELIGGTDSGRTRTSDIAARLGGEEFALLLPETTKAGAIAKANRVRETIAGADLPGGQHLTVTVGMAALPDDAGQADGLLGAAEGALRAAKQAGKSQVHFLTGDGQAKPTPLVVAPPPPPADRFRPYAERMGEVVAILQRDRAVSCLYLDLSQLARIQLEQGVAPHAELFERAGSVLDGLRGQLLRTGDLICRSNDEDAYVCLLSPRDASQVDLERLAAAVGEAVAGALAPAVRELLRDEPRVNVGSARVLSNPMVRPERLVARLVSEATEAARLSRQRAAVRDKSVLQDIILGDALVPVYQPIVHLEHGETFGFEALTRGPRGTRMESPATLFAVADEVDLTYELDRACFRGALRRAVGLEPVHRLFVNLLPMSFYDSSFIEIEVSNLLSAADLTPANIVFEITERLAIENFAAFRRALQTYTSMGFGVAIDDVGTRHSNLETVMALRPHFIKVSDVLTRGVARSTVKREMLRSLGHIAETIDAVMVAEGIETVDDLVALRELGIRYGQGFFLARPGPPFPRVRSSVRRTIVAIGAGQLNPLPGPPADLDDDGDDAERSRPIPIVPGLGELDPVPRGSGDFALPPRLLGPTGLLGDLPMPGARPLAEELAPLAESLEEQAERDGHDGAVLGEIAEPGEDTQPHGPSRWRAPRPTPPTADPRSRPLLESLRRREPVVPAAPPLPLPSGPAHAGSPGHPAHPGHEDAPPLPDTPDKPGLN
jgi:diguanylate cyclase (GGDEF)-like protein